MNRGWYIDSSVFLNHLYLQRGDLDPATLSPAFTSALCRVECMRSLDRNRLLGKIGDRDMVDAREFLFRMFRSLRVLELDASVMDRASGPIAVPLKTLDAIHLVSALQLKDDQEMEVTFVTHDRRLADAARACGLPVLGA